MYGKGKINMSNLINNYILMVITFVYACASFCDIYFNIKSIKSKLNLLFLPLSIMILSSGFLLELSTDGIFIYTMFSCFLIYTGLCFMGYSWFVFSTFISFKNGKLISLLNTITILPLLLIFFILISNPFHSILYILPHSSTEMNFSNVYFCILFIGGLYVLFANIILINRFFTNTFSSSKQKLILFIILAFLPICFYIRVFYISHFELVPLFLLIGYHIIIYSVSGSLKLFDIVPKSISSIVHNMEQAILIINKGNYVVNFNSSFINSFGNITKIKESDPLEVFVKNLRHFTALDKEGQTILNSMLLDIDKNISGNIHVNNPVEKWYFVFIQNVQNIKGKKIGKLISFNDITTMHNLNNELQQKNTELAKINEELKFTNDKIIKHTLMIEELSITRERNRILSELHDSIGQAYTSNLALARCTETLLLSNQRNEALDLLEEMTSTTEQLLYNITSSVNDKDTLLQQQPLKEILQNLFKSYRKSGIAIELNLDTDVDLLDYRLRHNIYRICQESINNALKHGMPKNIFISIKAINKKLLLEICDDGIGCDLVFKGIGLKGIEYRISELDGEVYFISDKTAKKGFTVRAEIPIRRSKVKDAY